MGRGGNAPEAMWIDTNAEQALRRRDDPHVVCLGGERPPLAPRPHAAAASLDSKAGAYVLQVVLQPRHERSRNDEGDWPARLGLGLGEGQPPLGAEFCGGARRCVSSVRLRRRIGHAVGKATTSASRYAICVRRSCGSSREVRSSSRQAPTKTTAAGKSWSPRSTDGNAQRRAGCSGPSASASPARGSCGAART